MGRFNIYAAKKGDITLKVRSVFLKCQAAARACMTSCHYGSFIILASIVRVSLAMQARMVVCGSRCGSNVNFTRIVTDVRDSYRIELNIFIWIYSSKNGSKNVKRINLNKGIYALWSAYEKSRLAYHSYMSTSIFRNDSVMLISQCGWR